MKNKFLNFKVLAVMLACLALALNANAQLKRSETIQKPIVKCEQAQMRSPGEKVLKSNRDVSTPRPFYRRPAGVFPCRYVLDNRDSQAYLLVFPTLMLKPFSEYTYDAILEGVSANASCQWSYNANGQSYITHGKSVTVSYGLESADVPILTINDSSLDKPFRYQIGTYAMSDTLFHASTVYTKNNDISEDYGESFVTLLGNKTLTTKGRYGDEPNTYPLTYYYGAEPYGDNTQGWWFGKNADPRMKGGIANVFEKPEHPYLLKQVVMYCVLLSVSSPVEMTCKVYKLANLPAYRDDSSVRLNHVPGELIATGRATVTTDIPNDNGEGAIVFTLYDQNGQVITPVIDDAIFIAIEGYNDPEMAGLTDFTTTIGGDYNSDEGFGEMAYLLVNEQDGNGNYTGEVKWHGLNKFFNPEGTTMKTGYSIFVVTELPFVTFYNGFNDGQYTFPNSGGIMQKTINDETETSIKFFTTTPVSGGNWTMSNANNSGAVPSWLTIALTNQMLDEKLDYVNATVMAQPLPEGTRYREAKVRFSIPAGSIDFTFKQGEMSTLLGDVNSDGEVNITDAIALINYVLNDNADGVILENADTNFDGEVNISDVITLINYVLNDKWTGRTFTVNGVSFTMMHVDGGTFTMGATPEQNTTNAVADYPPHQVTLSSYFIGETEVTQELYQAVMNSNPSNFTDNPLLPVEKVSYNDCLAFILKLNQQTGYNFRLPTEAEWEFAARGGNSSKGYKYAGSDSPFQVGWININSNNTTHAVKGLAPNELGLYDMCGNVYEWVLDWYADYTEFAQVNPMGPRTGLERVIRGGSYNNNQNYCRNGYRTKSDPTTSARFIGFRLAL